ncbi:MAG: BPL-N domain-containing protein [Pseudomonadota bacterium]
MLLVCCAPATAQDASEDDAGARDGSIAVPTTIALYDGLGVWPDGFSALQGAIRSADLELRVVTAAEVRDGVLDDVAALVMGGGWAWDQWQGLGDDGISAIRRFVLAGGGYLGICAGAYLASDDVVWEGTWVAYPLNLFNGTAEGPVPGLPAWPDAGTAQVARVDGEHSLQASGTLAVYYQGGGAFVPRDPTEVVPLLRYADNSLAALALDAGHGRVVLTGVHLEMEQAASGAEALSGADNRALLDAILHWLRAP